jgi:anti-anti-sigma regulatory factor
MTVNITHLPEYTYISYVREGYRDLEQLKQDLADIVRTSPGQSNLVIDFSESDFIVSSEIRVIVSLLRKLNKSATRVHLIASSKVKQVLLASNLEKVAGFFMYDDLRQCMDRLGKRSK